MVANYWPTQILAPTEISEFVSSIVGITMLVTQQQPEKFAQLFGWSSLNDILNEHQFVPGRLQVFKQGAELNQEAYGTYRTGCGLVIQPSKLNRCLEQGATLVVNHVDELHMPVRQLATDMERFSRVRVGINLYASWRKQNGFPLHWDRHDTYVLQIAGAKRWTVYAPTRVSPLAIDVGESAAPTLPPVWDDVLNQGDMLYMPRGWWHLAAPIDEPSLHLTVGVSNPTGVDLLLWLVERLKRQAHVRSDLPHFGSTSAQVDYIRELSRLFHGELSENMLGEFMNASDGLARPRELSRLPGSVGASAEIFQPGCKVCITTTRPLHFSRGINTQDLQFQCGGRTFRCSEAVARILEQLKDGTWYRIGQLSEMVGATHSFEMAGLFLALSSQGFAEIDNGTREGLSLSDLPHAVRSASDRSQQNAGNLE